MATAEYRASHRFARIAVTKVRPVLDQIRGEYADEALKTLRFLPHRGARMVEKVLRSAMANAEEAGVRNPGDLVIADARGDGGPMFKRLMPRARGMAHLIKHRTAHINIGLSDYESYRSDGDDELLENEELTSATVVDDPATSDEADIDPSTQAVGQTVEGADETATETQPGDESAAATDESSTATDPASSTEADAGEQDPATAADSEVKAEAATDDPAEPTDELADPTTTTDPETDPKTKPDA